MLPFPLHAWPAAAMRKAPTQIPRRLPAHADSLDTVWTESRKLSFSRHSFLPLSPVNGKGSCLPSKLCVRTEHRAQRLTYLIGITVRIREVLCGSQLAQFPLQIG